MGKTLPGQVGKRVPGGVFIGLWEQNLANDSYRWAERAREVSGDRAKVTLRDNGQYLCDDRKKWQNQVRFGLL
jgi:hypothetical protein